MQTKIFLVLAGAFFAATPLHAQFSGASRQVDSIDQARQMEQPAKSAETNAAPELYAGETSDVGPQSLLRFKPRRTWFEVFADEQYFYSDNIFLADTKTKSDDVLVSTVEAALAPTAFEVAGGKLSPRLGYQHQWFNYDLAGQNQILISGPVSSYSGGIDTFDFNVSTLFADVAWRRNDWTLTAGLDYRRLLASDSYAEFYAEWVPRWAVRRDFSFGSHVGLSLLYEGNFRITQTQLPPPHNSEEYENRTDQSIAAVLNWRVCDHFSLQPFYRFQYTHYVQIRRDDTLNTFGLAAIVPITSQISLRAFVSYETMDTDGFFSQNYEKLDTGGGVSLVIRF